MFLSNSSHTRSPVKCAWSIMAESLGVTKTDVFVSVNPIIATSCGMRSPSDFIASKAA